MAMSFVFSQVAEDSKLALKKIFNYLPDAVMVFEEAEYSSVCSNEEVKNLQQEQDVVGLYAQTLTPGERVECQHKGKWYGAVIRKDNGDGTYQMTI